MTQQVLCDLAATVGAQPAESGGLLAGSRLDGVVDHYRFDQDSRTTTAAYSPDVGALNTVLRDDWNPAGVHLLGFVHSHPVGITAPSGGDREYALRIIDAIGELDRLQLPIVQTHPDQGRFECHPHIASGNAHHINIETAQLVVETNHGVPADPYAHDEFDRVANSYDLELLARTRVVVVGVGGAAGFVDDLVRCGIGEVVLVDPDTIERPNVATQQVYGSGVGHPKVGALAARLADTSPIVHVIGVHASLDDLDDELVSRLCSARLAGRPAPEVTLLCGFTDDFAAQARVARLGLHLSIPTLAAQLYAQGRGAEITFAVPGVTPACQRCVLGIRYRAILDHGIEPDVNSIGTTICATTRVNATAERIALAIIHGHSQRQSTAGAPWRELLESIATRNLVQIRLDPGIAQSLGVTAFDDAFARADTNRIVTDDTLWLPQQPENPSNGYAPCGDCGGTGNLDDSAGAWADTRLAHTRDE